MMKLEGPNGPRSIRFLRMLECDGWRMKVYGIAVDGPEPGRAIVAAAIGKAREILSGLELNDRRYGLGYVGVHDGASFNVVFVDWWENENEVQHRIFVSPRERPAELRDAGADGMMACVWDLRVMAFERDAWVANILRNDDGPDIEGYLAAHLNEIA